MMEPPLRSDRKCRANYSGHIVADDKDLLLAAAKVGERLSKAFRKTPFIYGTMGTGSVIVRGLKAWAGRVRTNPASGPNPNLETVIQRSLNLFDPGRRAEAYLGRGYQMMDMYYGQAGTTLHLLRDPAIAEFVHYAMGFKPAFSMNQSGRSAYMMTHKTKVEGWAAGGPDYNGLTATKEMSRIIRWGIHRYGGTLIFEGREVYYSQVFEVKPFKIGDTDLEARELFKFFSPGMSQVAFGKGKIIFHWAGRETVPTKVHFLSNWKWDNNQTHKLGNIAAKTFPSVGLLPIWNNFSALPSDLIGQGEAEIMEVLRTFLPKPAGNAQVNSK